MRILGGKYFISHKLKYFCFYIADWFSAADAVTGLKLVEEGVPKEHLAHLGSSNGSFANNIASDYQQIHCRSPAINIFYKPCPTGKNEIKPY